MANVQAGRFLIGLCSVSLLASCGDEGNINLFKEKPDTEVTSGSAAPSNTKLVERDVEVPEVFQVIDQGLWDGRPSLGGVWVAHPDVTEPERVIIRNEENGQYVIGALFRRERENPGPVFQVSSDAAAALGVLAGAPGQLNVTALRRQEVPISGEVPGEEFDTAEADPDAFDAPETIETASLDAIPTPDGAEVEPSVDTSSVETEEDGDAVGGAGIDVSGIEILPNPTTEVAGAAAGGAVLAREAIAELVGPDADSAPETDATIALDTTPELDESPELVALPEPVIEPEPEGVILTASALERAGVLPIPDSEMLPDAGIAAPVLTSVVPVAAPTPAPALTNVVPTAAPVEVEAPQEETQPEQEVAIDTDPDFTKRYIQIGLFSIQDNATRSSDRLREVGILPLVIEDKSNGKQYWRVLAGPAPTSDERTVLLAKVKALGYSDAYYVTE